MVVWVPPLALDMVECRVHYIFCVNASAPNLKSKLSPTSDCFPVTDHDMVHVNTLSSHGPLPSEYLTHGRHFAAQSI